MATQVVVQPQAQEVSGVRSTPLLSLYVGDLDTSITDSQLLDIFGQIGEVVSVRICRDLNGTSLGYGYVNYGSAQDAERALEELNFTPINGKPIRVMYSNRDPAARRNNSGNIFIKNLDKEIDHRALHEAFSPFGNILSCKVATTASCQSRGYGFVQYDSEESARLAIEKFNGKLLNGKQVFVAPFVRKEEREMPADRSTFTNVFVKNLSESVTEEDLKKIFGEFGSITSAVVAKNEDGTSKCFGFVNFAYPDDAARAVESLCGKTFNDKAWFVGRALKKSERELELKLQSEQALKDAASNLYVKNLDDSIDEDKLKDLFSPFGLITSCKVMQGPEGISSGSGFVSFSSPAEASQAHLEMNGKIIFNKPLYVAFAERKEDRRARLQAQFAQMRPMAMMTPRVPMYGTRTPGLGQPTPPAFISPKHEVPGMRQTGPLVGNMFMPMVQQGPHPCPTQQGPPSTVAMQPQMLPRGRGYRNPPGRAVAGGILSAPYDMGGLPAVSQPIPTGALASSQANSPANEPTMLGDKLDPLVRRLEPKNTAKITGKLLEMDETEVLHLLESPEALEVKVSQQLAELSLNYDRV